MIFINTTSILISKANLNNRLTIFGRVAKLSQKIRFHNLTQILEFNTLFKKYVEIIKLR